MSPTASPNRGKSAPGTSQQDWATLVEEATAGSDRARNQLFRTFAPKVFRWARALGQSSASAEDVVQDVFLQLFRSQSPFRGEGSVDGWLYRMTRNRALKTRRLVDRILAFTEAPPDIPDTKGPEDPMLKTLFWTVFHRLKPAHREVLLLVDMEGRSGLEAAELLRVPEGTVRSRLREARSELRRRLEQKGVLGPL